MKRSKKILFGLGFIWALPISIFGFLLGMFLLLFRQIERFYIREDFIVVWDLKNDGWFHRNAFEKRGWIGYSCGSNIFVKDIKNKKYPYGRFFRTILHEVKHCYQQYIWGGLFPFIYIINSIFIWLFLKKSHSYYDNYFEKEARGFAGQRVVILKSEWKYGPRDRWAWW